MSKIELNSPQTTGENKENEDNTAAFRKINKKLAYLISIATILSALLILSEDTSRGLDLKLLVLFTLTSGSAMIGIIIFVNNLLELNYLKTGRKSSLILKLFVFFFIIVMYLQLITLLG